MLLTFMGMAHAPVVIQARQKTQVGKLRSGTKTGEHYNTPFDRQTPTVKKTLLPGKHLLFFALTTGRDVSPQKPHNIKQEEIEAPYKE